MKTATARLLDSVDFFRLDANRKLDPEKRSDFGQFMTPGPTARLMASMFRAEFDHIHLLDAGAGVGSLTAAFVDEICSREHKPKSIHATAYEIDPVLLDYLRATLEQCERTCRDAGVVFQHELIDRDFIYEGVQSLREEMFKQAKRYECAILNPPYKKISQDSDSRLLLRQIGVETSNIYTGFLSVVLNLLAPQAEMVAITPRSFCNGTYFKPFRKLLLETLEIDRIHVFDSRQIAFQEDDVLQENVIFHGRKQPLAKRQSTVTISSSTGPADEEFSMREIPFTKLVREGDPDSFMHIVPDEIGASVAGLMGSLNAELYSLDLEVSTGRVVDFRAADFLRPRPEAKTVPLIYPKNFQNGFIEWPRFGKKPQAMALLPGVGDLLIPKGVYVLVKRFSSKEEDRRVVAAIYDPSRIDAEWIGFENHTNYYHRRGQGIPMELAKGLAAFLNSTIVDLYFRQFSGHTQVNAGDLRSLKYPGIAQLEVLGNRISDSFPEQETLDQYVQEGLFDLAGEATGTVPDPVKAKTKIDEALAILKDLGVPKAQQNERSALTLLSLLDLKPEMPWSESKDPLMGITPMMDFFGAHYGKRYAPNTRETVRRQTIHQFLDAGIVVINPDDPDRPTNSPKAVYEIEAGLLKLLRAFGTAEYHKALKTWLASVETLKARYAREREMKRIPIEVAPG